MYIVSRDEKSPFVLYLIILLFDNILKVTMKEMIPKVKPTAEMIINVFQ